MVELVVIFIAICSSLYRDTLQVAETGKINVAFLVVELVVIFIAIWWCWLLLKVRALSRAVTIVQAERTLHRSLAQCHARMKQA